MGDGVRGRRRMRRSSLDKRGDMTVRCTLNTEC